ncbi:unnamed protein product [Candidula unifasciata]|uniref:Uncharacterized protein n=1 Tax=Candidula unifasciata TaxID=100452 RepID=A0A8S3ZU98_9EUPU|nr:unnamed protein product [Candidula unifasciata]
MAPAPTHTDHLLTAAANQDKGPDGERHRADTIDSVIHVRDVSPTLSTLDAPSTDRFEDSTAAVFTSAAAASTTTSGSLSNCIQVNASYDPTNNSERGNDKSAEITGGSAVTCWCQLGHVCDRCCLNSMARAQPDPRELTELGSCHTGCTRGQPGTDITLARAPTNQTTDAMLPQKSDCELENTEAHGYLSVMERRQHKRKLGQSALFPLDVISVDISKQARVEENYSSNNLATEDRLMLTQGRLILMGDTVDTNVLSGESGTYHLHVDRRELGNERQAECLVASAVLDTSPVCEGKHRASGMAGGELSAAGDTVRLAGECGARLVG